MFFPTTPLLLIIFFLTLQSTGSLCQSVLSPRLRHQVAISSYYAQRDLSFDRDEETISTEDEKMNKYEQISDLFEGDIVTTKEQVTKYYGKDAADRIEAAGLLQRSEEINLKQNQIDAENERKLGIMIDYDHIWKSRDKGSGKVIVPYEILASMAFDKKQTIINAMKEIETKTNVVMFIPRSNEVDWIYFQNTDYGCYSSIGRRGGKQIINLQTGCGLSQAIHEIYHALGFWHEQSRSDRDSYISILWKNIQKSHKQNFNKQATNSLGSPYDYSSIMHYSSDVFGKSAYQCIPTDRVSNTAVLIHFRRDDLDDNMDYCLTIGKGDLSWKDGNRIYLRPCGDNQYVNQYWLVEAFGSSNNVLRAASNPLFCLTIQVDASGKPSNSPALIKECIKGKFTNQLFSFEQTSWDDVVMHWQSGIDFVLTRDKSDEGTFGKNTYATIIKYYTSSDYYNQNYRFEFISKVTRRSSFMNAFCELKVLTTMDTKGHEVGLQVLSEQDILQLQLLYQCPSGPRSTSSFCTSDCKCSVNQGNCTSDDVCQSGLKCEYDGYWLHRCKSTTFAPTTSPTVPTLSPSYKPSIAPTNKPVFACFYTDKITCLSDKECFWNKIRGASVCMSFDCSLLTKNKLCKNDERCVWKKNKCLSVSI